MLLWIQSIVAAIPATFWGVLIGSIFTLSGVLVSNRASDKRQRSQFEHEHTLRQNERELALRRDVYLSAAEAIQAGRLLLLQLGDLNASVQEQTKAYLAKAPSLAKVAVVASPETINSMAKFNSSIASAMLELTSKRVPIDLAREKISSFKALVSGFEKERERWLEEMKQLNLSGMVDTRRFRILQENYESEDKRIHQTYEEISKQQCGLKDRHFLFIKECASKEREIGALIAPILKAVRNELGIPFDEEDYKKTMEGQAKDLEAALEALMKDLNA